MPSESLQCLRCHCNLSYQGTKQFHEGTRAFDFMGGLFELFKHREAYDVYVCPRCGRIEFYLDGVGEAWPIEECREARCSPSRRSLVARFITIPAPLN